jgi:hypothetical protein
MKRALNAPDAMPVFDLPRHVMSGGTYASRKN